MNMQEVLGKHATKIDLADLKRGDIIAEHQEGHPISSFIAFFAGVPSHTMIYIGGNQIIEADEGAVIVRSFNKYNNTGTKLWVFRPDPKKVNVERFTKFHEEIVGKPYDFGGAIGTWFSQWAWLFHNSFLPDTSNPFSDHTKFFCDEAHAHALYEQRNFIEGEYGTLGKLMNGSKKFIYHPSNITPAKLVGSEYFTNVTELCREI